MTRLVWKKDQTIWQFRDSLVPLIGSQIQVNDEHINKRGPVYLEDVSKIDIDIMEVMRGGPINDNIPDFVDRGNYKGEFNYRKYTTPVEYEGFTIKTRIHLGGGYTQHDHIGIYIPVELLEKERMSRVWNSSLQIYFDIEK